MKRIIWIVGAFIWLACGPAPLPQNTGTCPAEKPANLTPCGSSLATCYYRVPAHACGAGSVDVDTMRCPGSDLGSPDAGTPVWEYQSCK